MRSRELVELNNWRFQWLGRVSTTANEPNRAPSDTISKCRNSCSDVRRNAMNIAFADFDPTGVNSSQ